MVDVTCVVFIFMMCSFSVAQRSQNGLFPLYTEQCFITSHFILGGIISFSSFLLSSWFQMYSIVCVNNLWRTADCLVIP